MCYPKDDIAFRTARGEQLAKQDGLEGPRRWKRSPSRFVELVVSSLLVVRQLLLVAMPGASSSFFPLDPSMMLLYASMIC